MNIVPRSDDHHPDKVEQIYNVIEGYTDIYGYAPTMEEIRDRVGLSSVSAVNWYLELLERFRFIERDRRISRGIRIIR